MDFNDNICIFKENSPSVGDINILHVVLETKKQMFDGWGSVGYYRMHYVVEGEGVLHTQYGDYIVKKGDIFLCLPSVPFAIQSVNDFKYIYIGFMGERANWFCHKLKFDLNNCVFHNYNHLEESWVKSVQMPYDISALYAEGLVMMTVSIIALQTFHFEKDKKVPNIASLIKKYVEENFAQPELSLGLICKTFAYNDKYISKIFKKEFNVPFKEYLNTIRINNACALMNKGFSSVKDVSFLCGFNDPLYFSKVFKSKMKQSPRDYMASVN